MPKTETTLNDGPLVECPHCGKAFWWDDYKDIKIGDIRQCFRCRKIVHVLFANVTINATLGTSSERA